MATDLHLENNFLVIIPCVQGTGNNTLKLRRWAGEILMSLIDEGMIYTVLYCPETVGGIPYQFSAFTGSGGPELQKLKGRLKHLLDSGER